jgi:hypothetical protein
MRAKSFIGEAEEAALWPAGDEGLCAKLDHTLSTNAQRYLDEVARAMRLRHAITLGAGSTSPLNLSVGRGVR